MSSTETYSATTSRAPETFPISALNQFLYCPRRAYLIHAEGIFIDNEHTVIGNLAHEHVDFPGYEQRAGWTLLRALPVFSDRLGLSGKADLVEVRYADFESELSNIKPEVPRRIFEAHPVEYKKGPKRRFDNDDVQLCAQALCLEEMFGIAVEAGAIFHAQSQQRHDVCFDDRLRQQTLAGIEALKSILGCPIVPPAELRPQCEGCSLHEVCLPELAAHPSRLRALREQLWHPSDCP